MFDEFFAVELVEDDAARKEHFLLRHRIFCELKQFEPGRRDRMERDEFDDRSEHFLVRARHSGQFVAAFRMVFPSGELPAQQITQLDEAILRRREDANIMELSRLCFDREGAIEALIEVGFGRESLRPEKPVIAGMLRAAAAFADAQNMYGVLGLVPPPLLRVYRSLGVRLELCGEECRHRGRRSPYLGIPNQVLQAMSQHQTIFDASLEFAYYCSGNAQPLPLPAAV